MGKSGDGIGIGDEGVPFGTARGDGTVDVVELLGLLKSATKKQYFSELVLFVGGKLKWNVLIVPVPSFWLGFEGF